MSRDFPFMLSLSKHPESFFSNVLADNLSIAADWKRSYRWDFLLQYRGEAGKKRGLETRGR